MQKIILASGSPRRRQILELANIEFEVILAETNESYPANLSPEKVAVHIAKNKAKAARQKINNAEYSFLRGFPLLSADTIVVVDNEITGKPVDRDGAIKMLQKLSGKKHLVITGVVILYNNSIVSFSDTTEVEFHELNNDKIEYYVDNFKPFDKAGAYAIQEWIGTVGIKSIKGDFYNVMGLPVSRVLMELQKI